MHFTTVLFALAASAAPAIADCSADWAKPDTGDIALYRDQNCKGPYLNVGAMGRCENSPNFDACSAVTNNGVVCELFRNDNCIGFVTVVDSAGYRNLCGTNVQSVYCRHA